MTRRLLAVLALVLASALAFAAPPAGAQEPPTCDVESDPGCETPPDGGGEDPGCDPEFDPDCPVPEPCDPQTEPECIDPDPGCDPEVDPDCPVTEPCDPEVDPDCPVSEPCDPPEACEGGGIAPPEHSQVDENCVYEYDETGFGSCTNGELYCQFTPLDDGSGLGHEACALSEVVGPATPSAPQPSSGATGGTGGSANETPRAAELPRTGAYPAPSIVLALVAIVTGAACCVAGRRLVSAR